MDPLTLVVTALVAGASAGATGATSMAITDAYTSLRDAMKRRLGRDYATAALDGAAHVEPHVLEAELVEALTGTGVDQDAVVLAAAKRLLGSADPAGASTGKYDLREAKGVQIIESGAAGTQTKHLLICRSARV